ncbi:MAG: molecular chaperone HtpG [Oscillospiraceae bacterium]
MAIQEFKAEAQRLMDLMINSIYTNKEIFLRELISNSSDAIDKLYYHSLKDDNTGIGRDQFYIRIDLDEQARTMTFSDNGIGMTKEELESNLGTIAKSGSLGFKNSIEKNEDIDIIGQFGVGFYSAFMVAQNVKVISKAYGSDTAYCWQSSGLEGFEITEADKETNGTIITLTLKENNDDDNYDKFLESYYVSSLVKKYSDYIRYPIKMDMVKYNYNKDKPDEEAEEEIVEETVNSMVPLWKKQKSEITEEEYLSFFKDKFYEYAKPSRIIHFSTEGAATFNALLYIPSQLPPEYYTKNYQKGLKLYSNGVLIMDRCEDLLPDHFSFVKGIVDSQDLSLNISREMLQQDRQLKIIAGRIEKKIKSELESMMNNDREAYDKFFKDYGYGIKFGVYNEYGKNSELLKDLIMFHSSTEKKLVTLKEYCDRMKEDQKYIYYACGESIDKIDKMPQMEMVRDKGYEVLYMTDNVDEFTVQILHSCEEKEFRNVSKADLDSSTEEEKAALEKQTEDNSDLFSFLKEALKDKVKDVCLSAKLKSYPVCLSAEGEISIEMEKMINQMPGDQKIKAEKVLEINPNHPIYTTLCNLLENDKDKLKDYANILYTQAQLIEGVAIDDPVAYSNAICNLLTDKI